MKNQCCFAVVVIQFPALPLCGLWQLFLSWAGAMLRLGIRTGSRSTKSMFCQSVNDIKIYERLIAVMDCMEFMKFLIIIRLHVIDMQTNMCLRIMPQHEALVQMMQYQHVHLVTDRTALPLSCYRSTCFKLKQVDLETQELIVF